MHTLHSLNNDIIHNFDLSIIMSFYKRYEEFARVLPHNAPYFQRNGIEVIIAMDEPSEKEKLIELIKNYPFINWKLIVNDKEHAPRNHAPVLNVALRHATKKYVMQIDPEVEMLTDVIWQMRDMLRSYPNHYAVAQMAYIDENKEVDAETVKGLNFMPYGNIMTERKHLMEMQGYDETFLKWGGEDDNLRARLDMLGIKKLLLPNALTLHREHNYNPAERAEKINAHTPDDWRRMRYPQTATANKKYWGQEFKLKVHDWQHNQYAEQQCRDYLQQFAAFEIKSPDVFQKKYKKLLLCQAHNEAAFMEEFLRDMTPHFDGIILLDDESNDGTWELATHEKLLLKVKKKRKGFNDIQNRNMLLDLASFFRADWLCFMDMDERFDNRFADFETVENDENVHVVGFRAVYLWNDEQTYKADIPYSDKGVLNVYRMFRPIGHTQINTQKKLHFMVCPYYTNMLASNILFKDYGSMKATDRKKKYERYLKEDTQKDMPEGYDYLLNNDNLLKIKDIK